MRDRDDLSFSMDEYNRRLDALREVLVHRELEGIIVTTPENICYLTGFETPGYYYFQALVVPQSGEPWMVVRLLEDSNVEAKTWIELSRPYTDTESPITALRYSLEEFGLHAGQIGYEKDCYFFRASEQEQLLYSAAHAQFVDCSGLVENLRLVKSDAEIDVMREAAAATEAGMRAGLAAVEVGVSENDLAAEIHAAMIRAGGEYPAISPFVAMAERSAIGHATWSGRKLNAGETVFLEVGGCKHRYHTAMMRTAGVGDLSPDYSDAERMIQIAMDAAIAAIRPGIASSDVDQLARSILDKYSHGGTQATRSGYSIGLAFAPDWGEGHILSIQPGEQRALEENMTFHLIPWLQVPGKAGIGLSETVRVTASGCESFFGLERKIFRY